VDASVLVKKDQLPARNLAEGELGLLGIPALTIPRHGSRPQHVPENFEPHQKLPGAINVSFYDGHVEQVRLEQLWYLEWTRNWQTPAKRPGLK